LPLDAHIEASKAMVDPNLAKVFVNMTDVVQRNWLMSFVRPGFD
jgi:hypothetical protein